MLPLLDTPYLLPRLLLSMEVSPFNRKRTPDSLITVPHHQDILPRRSLDRLVHTSKTCWPVSSLDSDGLRGRSERRP